MTACGLWEWNVASLQVVSKHHPGLFEHMAGVILQWMDDNAQHEPESWPPDMHQLIEVTPLHPPCTISSPRV